MPGEWLRRVLLPAILLFAITVGFYWKTSLSKQYTWLDSPDTVHQILPWLQFESTELQNGRLPLWDPHEIMGQPLVGQVQPGLTNPVLWPFLLLPQRDGHIRQGTVNWFFLTAHFLAAFFFFLLLRDRGVSTTASIFGGACFSLAGLPGSIGWPQMLYSMIWIPLILLFYLRSRDSHFLANSSLAGVFLGLGILSGHHNVPMFMGVVMAIFWCHDCVSARDRMPRVLAAAAFFITALLTAAAALLPAAEFGGQALRWVSAENPVNWGEKVPYSVHETFSIHPESILGIAILGVEMQFSLFLGWTAATLAFLALAVRLGLASVRFFAAAAALGLLYALGSSTLFQGLVYELLPGMDKARSPAMAGAIFHAGASALAAFGMDACRDAHPAGEGTSMSAWIRRAVWFLAAYGVLGQLAVGLSLVFEYDASGPQRFLGLSSLFAIGAAVLLKAWTAGHLSARAGSALIVILMLAETNPMSTFAHRPVTDRFALYQLYEDQDVARYLRALPQRPRVEFDKAAIPYNFGDWHGVDEFASLIPAVIESVVSTMYEPGMREVFAVSHYVGSEPRVTGQVEVFAGISGLRVYRDPSALPRWRTVHSAVAASDWREASKMVSDRRIDPAVAASLEGEFTRPETCDEPDAIRLVEYRSSRVAFRANMACRGWLILADSWYPGWEARIDGQETPVHRAYGAIRAVEVPAGSHGVEFVYRPRSLYAGLVSSGAGLLLPLALFGWERRSARRREEEAMSAAPSRSEVAAG